MTGETWTVIDYQHPVRPEVVTPENARHRWAKTDAQIMARSLRAEGKTGARAVEVGPHKPPPSNVIAFPSRNAQGPRTGGPWRVEARLATARSAPDRTATASRAIREGEASS